MAEFIPLICPSSASYYQQGYISSRFSSNYDALASELLENLEEMFLLHYIRSDRLSMFNFSQPHNSVLPVTKGLMIWYQSIILLLLQADKPYPIKLIKQADPAKNSLCSTEVTFLQGFSSKIEEMFSCCSQQVGHDKNDCRNNYTSRKG